MRMVGMDDGVRLRTWTTGTAGELPPVVLLHGGPGLWDYLEPVARLLAPLTVVHRFDQRGCGGSDPSDEQTLARYVADVEALRRHWGHRTWVVLGHSFGATLAFDYAVAHPGHTAALGYLSGVGVGDWRTPYRRERQRRMTAAQFERLADLDGQAGRTRDEEIEYRALCWFTDYADPVAGWAQAVADARPDVPINMAANRRLVAETDAGEAARLADARRIAHPCWFLHGAADPRPADAVAKLAAAVPGARMRVIDGAGHQPWFERPDELGAVLRELLAEAGRTCG
ncbi:alpha/beta hydrolase [Catellatospora sp. NPDC049609]|uniref:alpha/beta fold hydrolase n=1 Tax=Catellatospora sp. NPDC049609 TaxID=3155505 RepID=UPI00343D679C